jgi:archaemetzincin
MERVLIIPFGEIDQEVLDVIASRLYATFGCDTVIQAAVPVPSHAYNPARHQYRSAEILRLLEKSTSGGRDRVLAIIDLDLYVSDLNFVFGEADITAGVAVISLTRLRQEFYDRRPDRAIFLLRAAKEAVHELGHTIGFGHCPDPRCIMHFSDSLDDTDRKGPGFCRLCKGMRMTGSGVV